MKTTIHGIHNVTIDHAADCAWVSLTDEPDAVSSLTIFVHTVAETEELIAAGHALRTALLTAQADLLDEASKRVVALIPDSFTVEQHNRLVTIAEDAIRAGDDVDQAITNAILAMSGAPEHMAAQS